MTLNQLADALAINFGREEDYAFRLVLRDAILIARASVIKELAEGKNTVSPALFQTADCLGVRKVTDNECGKGEYIYRTVEKIPRPIITKTRFMYLTVFSTIKNKRTSVDLIRPEDVEFVPYRRFTSKQPFSVYENEYLYFGNVEGLEYISIRILAENPFTVQQLNTVTCECEECIESNCFEEGDLLIEESIAQKIKIIIYNEYQNGRVDKSEEIKVQELPPV